MCSAHCAPFPCKMHNNELAQFSRGIMGGAVGGTAQKKLKHGFPKTTMVTDAIPPHAVILK